MKIQVNSLFRYWLHTSSTIIGLRLPKITGRRIAELIVERNKVIHWLFWFVVEVPMIVIIGSILFFAVLFTALFTVYIERKCVQKEGE